jgi:hypothetical protein
MNEQNLYRFFRPTVYFSFNFNLSCSLKEKVPGAHTIVWFLFVLN